MAKSIATDEHSQRKNAPVVPDQLKFESEDNFYRELRSRVNGYFQHSGRSQRDCVRMYVKTTLVLVWFAASYVLLVFNVTTGWVAVPVATSLALSMAAIGFNIQHDGSHGAYSKHPWINKLMAMTLDLLGGSSYGWACKHNIVHHTYANIHGHDDDIDIGILGRLSPHQRRFKFHRWQFIYLWFLYGFVAVKWHFYDDFRDVINGRFGGRRHARPKGWDLAIFVGGKALFFSLVLVVPLMLHSVWAVLGYYLAVSFVEGIALSMVFQLPHCVEQAAFPLPQTNSSRMETSWAMHQVQTTVNYACGNRLLSWFIGGLNFQIEHHLFPRICHVNYPAIAPLVEQTCEEFGVCYKTNNTFRSAIASHYRWLRKMGMPGAIPEELELVRKCPACDAEYALITAFIK